VRQLAAAIGEDSTNVSRELAHLEQAGLLVSITEGRPEILSGRPEIAAVQGYPGAAGSSARPSTGTRPESTDPFDRRLKINRPELAGFAS